MDFFFSRSIRIQMALVQGWFIYVKKKIRTTKKKHSIFVSVFSNVSNHLIFFFGLIFFFFFLILLCVVRQCEYTEIYSFIHPWDMKIYQCQMVCVMFYERWNVAKKNILLLFSMIKWNSMWIIINIINAWNDQRIYVCVCVCVCFVSKIRIKWNDGYTNQWNFFFAEKFQFLCFFPLSLSHSLTHSTFTYNKNFPRKLKS